MKKLILIISLISQSIFSLPTIKAISEDNKIKDWNQIEKEADKDGPGFFYFDCAIELSLIKVSSSLPKTKSISFDGKNLLDFDPRTAWMTNKNKGIGEYFILKVMNLGHINVIYNGFQATPKLWKENARVKKMKVYMNNKALAFLELKDVMGAQMFDLPLPITNKDSSGNIYKFEILEIYKGTKYKDVGISHIMSNGCCFTKDTEILSNHSILKANALKNNLEIVSYNLNTNQIFESNIQKFSKQKHLSLIQIKTNSKSIQITPFHPLYVKEYGFISPIELLYKNKFSKFEDLEGKVEFLVIDKDNKKIYEKLLKIQELKGIFETYSILKIENSETYIINGFLSKTYFSSKN